MKGWLVLHSGKSDAAWNMALDEALLEFAREIGRPVLRFYGWTESAASFGYFQHYRDVEGWTGLRPLVRRPTGGGLVAHDADWTYALIFPPIHEWHGIKAEESYRRVHEWVSAAFGLLRVSTELAPAPIKEVPGRCFVGAEKFDLLWSGRKIAGAAQRRNKFGLLVQGSVQEQPKEAERTIWEKMMLEAGTNKFGAEWEELKPPAPLLERAEYLKTEKYLQASYNQRR